MVRYTPFGATPYLSPDGLWIGGGYEQAFATAVDGSVQKTVGGPGGAIWPCGWFNIDLMAFERPTDVPPGATELWAFGLNNLSIVQSDYDPTQAPGHNGLAVINGKVLSYNPHTKRIFYEHEDITPAGVVPYGVTWDGQHVLWTNQANTIAWVMRLSDKVIVRELPVAERQYAKPITLGPHLFTLAQRGNATELTVPWATDPLLLSGELPAGMTAHPVTGEVLVWTCLTHPQTGPDGVIGRPIDQWAPDKPGIRAAIHHSGFAAMARADGYLLAGFRTDSYEQSHEVVEFDRERVLYTPDIAPVDPVPPSDIDAKLNLILAKLVTIEGKVDTAVAASTSAASAAAQAATAALEARVAADQAKAAAMARRQGTITINPL